MEKRYLRLTLRIVGLCGTILAYSSSNVAWPKALFLVAFLLLAIDCILFAVKMDKADSQGGK